MKTLFPICILVCLTSCSQDSGSGKISSSMEKKIRKQVIDIAESFAKNKFNYKEKKVTNDGSLILSTADLKCVINPSYIIIGEINEDTLMDAVFSIFTFQGQGLPLKEHFILINKNGKLSIAKELDGEMRFLSISNRTIFIETSKMAPDSPNADCHLCKVIKGYKFIAGDTVVIR